jgi:cell shape-determining protein MreC
MLLRIFLIVSILAGAGIGAITHFMVKPHVEGIIKVRNDYIAVSNKFDGTLKKTSNFLAQVQNTLKSTKDTLGKTETELASTIRKLGDEKERANGLKADLDTAKEDLSQKNMKLASWDGLGMTPDQIKGVISDNKRMKVANDVLEEEKQVMQNMVAKLEKRLKSYTEQTTEVEEPLPAGLKGNVVVVDPKWDFVVLDIGEKQNVVPHGVMMVSRDGKLIAKVKIVSVQPNRCIANIMPQWRLGDVMEGDLALSKN